MAQILLTIAGTIGVLLGAGHGLLALGDVRRPRAFTPSDDSVRVAMQGARLAFNPRMNLWQAWLGFNLSHALGVGMFGAAVLYVGRYHLVAFEQSGLFQAALLLVAASYLVLAVRFWFWGPALGAGAALLCIAGAVVL
jgi:hypothetical protein